MCSNHSICGGNRRSNRAASSGAHYALCALGVGLIALGIVMIVWTFVPFDSKDSGTSPGSSGNSTVVPANENDGNEDDSAKEDTKSSTVALVLIGVGVVMLFLSICLALRSKKRASSRTSQPARGASTFMDHIPREEEQHPDPSTYNVPSYEEAVGSGEYPVRQSNLRQSISQLPSYEDIIAAVENEGTEPANGNTEDTSGQPATEPPAESTGLTSTPSMPTRSSSRASRLLRPLRVRRIKSDKLHLRDIRIQIRTPTQNPVTIEPITPPPQYENKMPELQ
ncbi:transmembrane protein 51b [Pholidichthys leucotaenia]